VPELPEVAAHAERLDTAMAGSALTRFEPLSFTALKTFSPPPEGAHGSRLRRVVSGPP
jgi:formamidopyrimidine-DNA glycosylase